MAFQIDVLKARVSRASEHWQAESGPVLGTHFVTVRPRIWSASLQELLREMRRLRSGRGFKTFNNDATRLLSSSRRQQMTELEKLAAGRDQGGVPELGFWTAGV